MTQRKLPFILSYRLMKIALKEQETRRFRERGSSENCFEIMNSMNARIEHNLCSCKFVLSCVKLEKKNKVRKRFCVKVYTLS